MEKNCLALVTVDFKRKKPRRIVTLLNCVLLISEGAVPGLTWWGLSLSIDFQREYSMENAKPKAN